MPVTRVPGTQRYERDRALRERARRVLPGGMYGHQSTAHLPEGFPQFFSRGEGSRVWDADGNEYIDFMCAYGPIVLGHRHPAVEAAAAEQRALGDCFTAPTERIVELGETLTRLTPHADWCLFAKNGTDANLYALTVARAHTGRRVVLRAPGAYHGWAPVWQAEGRPGVLPEDVAHQLPYRYNDTTIWRASATRPTRPVTIWPRSWSRPSSTTSVTTRSFPSRGSCAASARSATRAGPS
jgi:glutamate-1-semialdehyde 2,1-aminomutase